MELNDIEQGLKYVSSSGLVLSCQEQYGLLAGLGVLRAQQESSRICLWGKILGRPCDYWIAYRLLDGPRQESKKDFFYALQEDFDFKPLPLPPRTPEMALAPGKLFTGNPQNPVEESSMEGEAEDVSGKTTKLSELDRLAQVVQEIDFDTAVVPRGAFALNEAQAVVPSSDFKGLAASEAKALSKYVHFRAASSVETLRAQARTDAEFYANFLDSLEGDLPKGCWAVRQDPAVSVVTLRSLVWQGYTAYHVPGTAKFGGLYVGYGQKCTDLPFLL